MSKTSRPPHSSPGSGQEGGAAPLVLASASPRRANILTSAGFRFESFPADIDESSALKSRDAQTAATSLAEGKARSVANVRPAAVVIGADTIVVLDGRAIGKPAGPEQALEMLRALRGREHVVVTGVAVCWPGGMVSGTEKTMVTFRRYSEEEIAAYIATGSPLDKAGAYGIQDRPFSPARRYDGCYLNVVGLPLCLVANLLRSACAPADLDVEVACPGHSVPRAG